MAIEMCAPYEPDHLATRISGMPLTATHNYTDTFGRTSCGSSELEHFRLRALGLTRAIKPIAEALEQFNSEQTLLESWLEANRQRNSPSASALEVLQKLVNMTPVVAIRRLGTINAEKHRSKVTLSALNNAADRVVKRYCTLTCRELFGRIQARLPQELIDIIFDGVVGGGRIIDCDEQYEAYSWGYSHVERDRSMLSRWCFDSAILGDGLASDLLEAFFRKSVFQVDASPILKAALTGSLAPKKLLRETRESILDIMIRLPFRWQESAIPKQIWDRKKLKKLRQHTEVLKTLKKTQASITLDFSGRRNSAYNWQTKCLPRRYSDSVEFPAFRPDDLVAQDDPDRRPIIQCTRYHYLDFVNIARTLEPLLSELFSRGHTIHFVHDENCWHWSERSAKMVYD